MSITPKIEYAESKFAQVPGTDSVSTDGIVVPDGQTIAIHRFVTGAIASPEVYVQVGFDIGGASEKIFFSMRTDAEIHFDPTLSMNQVTGDGVKKIQMRIVNDGVTSSPGSGGFYEAINV